MADRVRSVPVCWIKYAGIGGGRYCLRKTGWVVPNPRLSKVHEGIELCRKEKVDFILAVGGGSVIDSAKAIAFGVPYEGEVWDFYMDEPMRSLSAGCYRADNSCCQGVK